MDDDAVKLSRKDRYIISNQLKILEVLYPSEAQGYAVAREAFERGYEIIYEWNFGDIYKEGEILTPDEALEVWDTLDMFDALSRYMDKAEIVEPLAKFQGYDGNNEGKFMAFTAYTMERLERYQYIDLPRDKYYNSHWPTRDMYGRMVEQWKQIPQNRRFKLSDEDFHKILNVRTG